MAHGADIRAGVTVPHLMLLQDALGGKGAAALVTYEGLQPLMHRLHVHQETALRGKPATYKSFFISNKKGHYVLLHNNVRKFCLKDKKYYFFGNSKLLKTYPNLRLLAQKNTSCQR